MRATNSVLRNGCCPFFRLANKVNHYFYRKTNFNEPINSYFILRKRATRERRRSCGCFESLLRTTTPTHGMPMPHLLHRLKVRAFRKARCRYSSNSPLPTKSDIRMGKEKKNSRCLADGRLKKDPSGTHAVLPAG